MHLSSVQKSILINVLIGASLLALVVYVLWVRKFEVVKETAVDLMVPSSEGSVETVFLAEDVTGIRKDKSAVLCRGVRIGVVDKVGKPQLKSDGTIVIRLTARIQKDYAAEDWKFSNRAELQSGALTGGFVAAAIDLIYDSLNGHNLTGHEFVLESTKRSVDDATEAVRDLSQSIKKTFDQLNSPVGDTSAGPETKLDRLLEAWRLVAERLGNELDRSDEASLVSKSRHLVDETGDFFRSSERRFDEVHNDLRDVLGETASERRALRRKANELLDSADGLTSRVGDTFLGKLLIRSEQKKAKEAQRLGTVPREAKRKQSANRESATSR
jgi:ABC-type transporter Mla subunit MlaD